MLHIDDAVPTECSHSYRQLHNINFQLKQC
jgi:hypothetical protein